MALLNGNKTTTTTTTVTDFSADPQALDYVNTGNGETYWEFNEAQKNFGEYKTIPEIYSSANALATWTTGKGWETTSNTDSTLKSELEHVTGWGEDTFETVMWNMIVVKKIVGDAFCEVIRSKSGKLLNLKPISPERVRLVLTNKGLIKRYDIRKANGEYQQMEKDSIFHISNNRLADEIHGTSQIDACRWVIEARNEALRDERMIKHRDLAMGVLEVDTDNTTKINTIKEQYAAAVKNGEVLVLPKDLAELKQANNVSTKDRLEWIRYLENFFYQTFGVPRIIATNEGSTEAGGKIGYLTFEPVYTREQRDLEADLWNQLGIKIKFNRPDSLGGTIQQEEAKNTGQLAIQPNDVQATTTPE